MVFFPLVEHGNIAIRAWRAFLFFDRRRLAADGQVSFVALRSSIREVYLQISVYVDLVFGLLLSQIEMVFHLNR